MVRARESEASSEFHDPGRASTAETRAMDCNPVSARKHHWIFARCGSAVGEEVLQQRAALGLEYAAAYLYAMVEPRIPYDVEE